MIKVTGLKKTRQRWLRIANNILAGEKQTVHRSLIAGRNYAKSLAPIDTKAMINAIQIKTIKGNQGWLISSQPNHPTQGTKIPYHMYMHLNPSACRWRGDPQFMFTTREWLHKKFPSQMRLMVKSALTQ